MSACVCLPERHCTICMWNWVPNFNHVKLTNYSSKTAFIDTQVVWLGSIELSKSAAVQGECNDELDLVRYVHIAKCGNSYISLEQKYTDIRMNTVWEAIYEADLRKKFQVNQILGLVYLFFENLAKTYLKGHILNSNGQIRQNLCVASYQWPISVKTCKNLQLECLE